MKKLIVVSLSALLAIGMLTGCGKDNDDTVSDDEFVVGFDANFPPYGYQDDNGEYVGFDLDLAAEVADRNDWTLTLQPIDWDSKDLELDSGNIDCIWNGFTINGREDEYTWTQAYVDNSQVFVVKGDSITSFDDLAGKVVAVQTDSSAQSALESDDNKALTDSFAELVKESDYNTAFMDLESGSVDAVALDIGVANYQIEQRGDEYVMLDEELLTEQYGVGFKLGNTELRDQVEETMLEMVDDGTFEEIAEKWDLQDSVILGE